MGAFSAEVLANLANVNLDFHVKGGIMSQIIQDRPMFNDLWAGRQSFPGGKFIDGNVKGEYESNLTGYTNDDVATFKNPTKIKKWRTPWYECQAGIKIPYTELKENGISVNESGGVEKASDHTGADMIRLASILDDKYEDLLEGSKRSAANMFWQDGTQDALAIPGVLSLISATPTVGSTMNISRSNTWWRNRASLGLSVTTPSDLKISEKLIAEMRQLRRFGTPKHKLYCGSAFLDSINAEYRSKGNFTLNNWSGGAAVDMAIADARMGSLTFQYDPHLDDLGYSKYCFVLDLNAIKFRPMEGEEWKTYTPHRPPEEFVLYSQLTMTGAITANRLNSSGIYSIA